MDEPASYFCHTNPNVRRLAISVGVAAGLDAASINTIKDLAADDADGMVRAVAIEALGLSAAPCSDVLVRARRDSDARVIEAVATAYGELRDRSGVSWLMELAASDFDRGAREAAVAALGAIGDDRAVPLLLDLVTAAPPQVRRRSVVALTVFDDPLVEPAIRTAARDRNPSVREAAEMVVGRTPD